MSLKIPYLEYHLNSYPENLCEASDEQGENFTKILWQRKSGAKASGPQVCWQIIVGH
jgi:hypothetical protein